MCKRGAAHMSDTNAEQSTGLAKMEIANLGNNTYSVHTAFGIFFPNINLNNIPD